MALRFRRITGKNYHECMELSVRDDQANCFYFNSSRPNMMSLAEAYVFGNRSQVLAICDGKTMVGALFYTPAAKTGSAWLTRLMIDKRYQGKGYGRKAMEMLIRRVSRQGAKRLGLSYEPHNKQAETLYLSLGFKPSEKAHGQTVAWLDLSPSEPRVRKRA